MAGDKASTRTSTMIQKYGKDGKIETYESKDQVTSKRKNIIIIKK